jgi:hypothetical protein
MDRRLLIKGRLLIESWEDLNSTHLYNFIKQHFPVAFKETEDDLFEAYPIGIVCNGRIIHIPPKPTNQAIDAEYTKIMGWDAATKDNEVFQELYFSVIAANDYLSNKGFRINESSVNNWNSRVSQAKRTATTLDDEYIIKHQLEIDSEEFRKWCNFINSIKTTKKIRLSLTIYLDSLTGKSNAELKATYARASISRYKSDGRKFIAKNHEMFQHLPHIPLL